jgi:hypothetical protein
LFNDVNTLNVLVSLDIYTGESDNITLVSPLHNIIGVSFELLTTSPTTLLFELLPHFFVLDKTMESNTMITRRTKIEINL